jgi:hypothetical protein
MTDAKAAPKQAIVALMKGTAPDGPPSALPVVVLAAVSREGQSPRLAVRTVVPAKLSRGLL